MRNFLLGVATALCAVAYVPPAIDQAVLVSFAFAPDTSADNLTLRHAWLAMRGIDY